MAHTRSDAARSDGETNPDSRDAFAAFVTDDATRTVIATVAERRQWDVDAIRAGGLAAALRTSVGGAPAHTVVVDITGVSVEEIEEGVGELARAGATVLAIGSENDVHLFRRLTLAGARDYLVKPITAEQIDDALQHLQSQGLGGGGSARGIAFVGARGGVGTTTVTSNAAWLIGEIHRRRTALLDLDLTFGTVSLSLDMDPTPALKEIMEDPERIDDVFLKTAMAHVGKSLSVFAAEEPIGSAGVRNRASAPHIFKTLLQHFDVVIGDIPKDLIADHPALLDEITTLCLVTEPTMAGVRDVNRLIRFVQGRSQSAEIRVIVNRVPKKPELSRKEVERGVDRRIDAWLPEDAQTMIKGEVMGQPVAAFKAKAPWVQQLAGLLPGMAGLSARKKRPVWKRFLAGAHP